jgi:ribonuclease inhibitor
MMDKNTHDHTVDLSGVRDRALLHARLQDSLGLPSWYGRNLDALYDALTDASAPLKICFTGWEALQESEPEYFDRFCRVLRDVESALAGSTFAFAQSPEVFYAAEKESSPEDFYTKENFSAAEDSAAEGSSEDIFVPEDISPSSLPAEED